MYGQVQQSNQRLDHFMYWNRLVFNMKERFVLSTDVYKVVLWQQTKKVIEMKEEGEESSKQSDK